MKVGDRVMRNKAVGGPAVPGDTAGTILKVTAVKSGAGGTRARIRVLWDNGHEGSVEDRQLVLAPTLSAEKIPTLKEWDRVERRATRRPPSCSYCGDPTHRLPDCPKLRPGEDP